MMERMTNTPEFPESSSDEHVGATGAGGATATLPPTPPPPGPPPVPRRSNGWAIFLGIVATAVAAGLIVLIGLLAIAATIVAGIASGEIDVDTDQVEIAIAPANLADIPQSIIEENGDIEIDLTELDIAELQASDEAVGLNVNVDFGEITVIVPEELDVSVDASVDVGDITVFGDNEDGFDNTLIRSNPNADVALDLDLNVGKINVVRG